MPAEVMNLGSEHCIDKMCERYLTILETHQCRRREQGHHALSVVENARRLENKYKSKRHKRIHHACHQAIDNHF